MPVPRFLELRSAIYLLLMNQVMNPTMHVELLKKFLNRMTGNFANVLMLLSVRDVITLNIVQMIRLIQSTDGVSIY